MTRAGEDTLTAAVPAEPDQDERYDTRLDDRREPFDVSSASRA